MIDVGYIQQIRLHIINLLFVRKDAELKLALFILIQVLIAAFYLSSTSIQLDVKCLTWVSKVLTVDLLQQHIQHTYLVFLVIECNIIVGSDTV
jgi:hypothetical protein